MFNTLKYAKMLEGVGFSRDQSEATVHILSEVMESTLSTKQDILLVKQDIQLLRQDMQLLKSELIIKMGAMQAASIAIIVALIKLL